MSSRGDPARDWPPRSPNTSLIPPMSSLDLENLRAVEGPILIAGASGFIGANLFRKIALVRKDVFALVRQNKGWRLADINDEQIVEADLNNLNTVKYIVDNLRPRTVFDCTAYGAYSFEEDVGLIHRTNFLSMVDFVELLSQAGLAAYELPLSQGLAAEPTACRARASRLERDERMRAFLARATS